MTIKQANANAVWTEPRDSAAANAVTPMHFVDDGAGHWVLETASVGNPSGIRLLDDGAGHYTTHAGPDNPTNVKELRLVSVGTQILTYE